MMKMMSLSTGLAPVVTLPMSRKVRSTRERFQGFANFGMFVQVNDRIKGLVHKSNIKAEHKERDSILVRVRQIRPNGNIDLEEVQIQVYQVQNIERKSTTVQYFRPVRQSRQDRGH